MKSAKDHGPKRGGRPERRRWLLALGLSVAFAEVVTVLIWPAASTSALRPPRVERPTAATVQSSAALCAVPAVKEQAPSAPAPQVRAAMPVRQTSLRDIQAALRSCRSFDEPTRRRVAAAIEEESRRYGYDPMFVLAMIHVESTCRPTVRGPRGAVGLIQVKPSTAKIVAERLGLPWEGAHMLERPALNVRLGLRYLWDLERRFSDPILALAAYNLGPTRVARMDRNRARQARYVRRVVSRYENLLAEHGPYSS